MVVTPSRRARARPEPVGADAGLSKLCVAARVRRGAPGQLRVGAVLTLAEAGTAGADLQRAQRVLLSQWSLRPSRVTDRLDLAAPAAGHEHFFPPHRAVGLHHNLPAPGLLSGPLRSAVQV